MDYEYRIQAVNVSEPLFRLDFLPVFSISDGLGRFAVRLSGQAFGLALAVRPAGSAEVSGAQGWVLKIVSAKRLETLFGCP